MHPYACSSAHINQRRAYTLLVQLLINVKGSVWFCPVLCVWWHGYIDIHLQNFLNVQVDFGVELVGCKGMWAT